MSEQRGGPSPLPHAPHPSLSPQVPVCPLPALPGHRLVSPPAPAQPCVSVTLAVANPPASVGSLSCQACGPKLGSPAGSLDGKTGRWAPPP